MDWREHIESKPGVLGGKPVIRGTRISVELVLEYLEDGAAIEDIIAAYPHITEQGVRAAIAFARELLIETAGVAKLRAA